MSKGRAISFGTLRATRLASVLSCALASVLAISLDRASAAPSDGKDLVEEVQETRRGVVEAEARKRKVLGSLYVINQRMKKISSEKGHLTDELFQVQDNINHLGKVIAGLETQIEKQRISLRRRLRALYKLSGEGYLAIIFSRSSAADLDESMRFLKIVTDNDHQLIRSYQQNVATYTAQKKKLRGQVERLISIERNIKRKEGMLAAEHVAKSRLVTDLDRAKFANLDRLKRLRSKTSETDLISDLLKPSIFERKGQLPAPIDGRVVQDFGLIRDERFKIRLSHKGWRYQAMPGAPIAAVFEGKVVHSDWVQGYGQTVVVDHGDHYYTVYALISRVGVKPGDTLKQGQVFAEAGPGGAGSNYGLYFELRHFSEPENPANWISVKRVDDESVAALSEIANGPASGTLRGEISK